MDTPEDEMDWKTMYDNSSAELKTLEALSKDVLKEYDVLHNTFDELKQQNEELHKKVVDKDKQLIDFKDLIQPALTEYEKLKNKYDIEKGCRYEAQSYAAQVHKQNHKLKRQSMDLLKMLNSSPTPLSIADINIDDGSDEDTKMDEDYKKTMNANLKELKNEVATLQATLKQTQDDLHIEKENYKWAQNRYKGVKEQLTQTEVSLKQHKDAIKKLSEVSEAAYQEYEGLNEKYELEMKRRSFVEKKVVEYAEQNNKMKRQSNALMLQVTPGDKLHHALMEIDDLSEKLSEQRKYYDAQIAELESQIPTCIEGAVESLEGDKKALTEEKEELQKRIEEYEQKYSTLEAQYLKLQKEYEDSKRPPPPPPPPPPPMIKQNMGFLSRLTGKKKKAEVDSKLKIGGANVNDDFTKALEEMMSNIKKGKTLRPSLKPIKRNASESQQTGQAMAELHDMVSKMKRAHSESELLAPIEESDNESELAKAFRKVRKQPSVDEPVVKRSEKLTKVSEERESEVLNDDVFSHAYV